RSTSKKPVCPMTRSLHPPMAHCGQRVRFVATWREEFFKVPFGLLLPHIEAGKLRALAVADEARSLQLPNVPTTVESGWPKLKARSWSPRPPPAGTPTSIVNRLNTEINPIMRTKEMEAILAKLSAKPEVGSPKDLATFIAAETQKWAAVVNAANIKVD